MFRDFFSDPILYLSFSILGLTVFLMGFYAWYFISKVVNSKSDEKSRHEV